MTASFPDSLLDQFAKPVERVSPGSCDGAVSPAEFEWNGAAVRDYEPGAGDFDGVLVQWPERATQLRARSRQGLEQFGGSSHGSSCRSTLAIGYPVTELASKHPKKQLAAPGESF
jgi:hypothetical protein